MIASPIRLRADSSPRRFVSAPMSFIVPVRSGVFLEYHGRRGGDLSEAIQLARAKILYWLGQVRFHQHGSAVGKRTRDRARQPRKPTPVEKRSRAPAQTNPKADSGRETPPRPRVDGPESRLRSRNAAAARAASAHTSDRSPPRPGRRIGRQLHTRPSSCRWPEFAPCRPKTAGLDPDQPTRCEKRLR